MGSDEGLTAEETAAIIQIQRVAPHLDTPTQIDVNHVLRAAEDLHMTRLPIPSDPLAQETLARQMAYACLQKASRLLHALDRGDHADAELLFTEMRRRALTGQRLARILDQRNPVVRPEEG